MCPTPPIQDAETPANLSPPASAQIGPCGPEGPLPQRPPLQYQASHHITKALFAPKQQIQPPASQVQVQFQVQLARSSANSPSPLQLSVSVPQQQPRPSAASVSKEGDEPAVQQHKHHSEFQPWPLPVTTVTSSHLRPLLQSQQLPWKPGAERLLPMRSQPLQQPRGAKLSCPRVRQSPAQSRPARRPEPRSDQGPNILRAQETHSFSRFARIRVEVNQPGLKRRHL